MAARPTPDWLEHYGRKLKDAASAAEWAYSPEGDLAFAVPLTLAATPVAIRLSRFEACKRWIEAALAVIEPDSRAEMVLSNALANALQGLVADVKEAETPCVRAIALARRLEDAEAQLRSEWTLWTIHINGADIRAALADLARFTELRERAGGAFEAVVADRMISVTHLVAGDLAMARPAIDRLLATAPHPGRTQAAGLVRL